MKTMGKVGFCTVESYSGGEFFEPNFLDTSDPILNKYFPNMDSPVGGVDFLIFHFLWPIGIKKHLTVKQKMIYLC